MDKKIQWALIISHLCNPAYLASLLLLIIGVTNPTIVLKPSFISCLFFLGVVPALIGQDSILLQRFPLKKRRKISFKGSFISYIFAFGFCLVEKADTLTLAISASYLSTVIFLLLVNLFYKASGHGGAVSGPVILLNLVFPGWGLFSLPLLFLVAWARLAAQEHTLAQILTGMAIGALSTVGAFLLIRSHCF
ncbi:MAG TPA: hypothetical protein VHR47_01650 [Bacillota bacterium]|nr:hypothetical protein [Bacillota bacterium]